jgi:GntR family transcriptional repressor for pyruvate dehydrogenase complex
VSEQMTFSPVGRTPRLSDTIAERLLDAIVAGHFEDGDLLPSERDLGLQFGVSRTVIREAVRALTTRGVVEVQSGRGVRVMRMDVGPVTEAMSLLVRSKDVDFDKLHEIRTMLERHTAGLAAERATEADHAELDEVSRQLAAAEDIHDVEAASLLDLAFHRTIAKATHNMLFLVLLDSISAALLENRRAMLSIPHDPTRILDEHSRIVAAIKRHDPIAAQAVMDQHLAHAAKAWHSAGVAHGGRRSEAEPEAD